MTFAARTESRSSDASWESALTGTCIGARAVRENCTRLIYVRWVVGDERIFCENGCLRVKMVFREIKSGIPFQYSEIRVISHAARETRQKFY